MLVAVPELGPRLACAPCDDDGSDALEVAEESTPQMGCGHVAAKDMDFVEPEDITDCRWQGPGRNPAASKPWPMKADPAQSSTKVYGHWGSGWCGAQSESTILWSWGV